MAQAIKRIQKTLRKSLALFIILGHTIPSIAFSASLNFSPSSGIHNQNQNFSVGIFVSSPEVAMNAASATINFPTDKLQVVSISKSGSIVDFWAQEPNFSNTTGQIKLEGVVLTPGYRGNSGRLLTVTFRGRNTGSAPLTISSSSILANDGIGTNIQKSVSSANFTIRQVEVKDPEIIKVDDLKPIMDTPKEEVCEPDGIITSSTHPGVVWRRENTAIFAWDVDDEVVASRIAFDRNPDTEPNITNRPAIVEKRYENLEDGIWYFHLSLQDNDGWRKTEHFQIKIDHTPPEIESHEIKRSDLTDPRVIVNLKVTDKISCVRSFELSVNGKVLDYERVGQNDYRLSKLPPGNHELVITAYDRAGNKNQKFLDVVINSIPEPEVTSYPAEIKSGETLVIKGETIPNGNVEAKIISKKNNFLIRQEFQSGSGRFTYEQAGLKRGTVFVSFKVTDSRGAESSWSKPVEIKVRGNSPIIIDDILNKLPPEILIASFALLLIIIILVTRALTIRKIKRDLGY